MQLTRAGMVGVVTVVGVALLLGGCAHRSDAGQDVVDEILQPTGAPSSLTPRDASGERTSPDGAWSIVLPEGAVEESTGSAAEGEAEVDYRMPDESEAGLPGVAVFWSTTSPRVGALEDSWTYEMTLKVNPSVSDLVRSEIDWPGAEVAVVTTWSEEVLMETGDTFQVEIVNLTLEGPDGMVVVRAGALAGELEGSTAWEALRTVRLGQG